MARTYVWFIAMEPLTKRQQDLLQYIHDFQSGRGKAPTFQEIGSGFGICIATAYKHVGALRKKGYLSVVAHARRGIRLAADRRAWKVRQAWRGDFDRRIGERLAGETDLRRILAIVGEEVRAWLGVERAELFVQDAAHRDLRGADFAEARPAGRAEGDERRSERDPLLALAVRRRRPVVAAGAGGPDLLRRSIDARPETAGPPPDALVALPVLGRDRVLGVLRLEGRGEAPVFDEVKLARAVMVAAALVGPLERGTLHEELRSRLRVHSALVTLVRSVNAGGDFTRILHDVYGVIRSLVEVECFYIAVKDETGQWWLLMEADVVDGKRWEDTTPHVVNPLTNPALRAIQTQPYYILHRTPEEIRGLEEGPRRSSEGWVSLGNIQKRSRSILCVPLVSGGERIGYISAQSYRYNAYSLRDAEDLNLIGEYVGLMLQGAWRRERERVRLAAAGRVLEGLAGLEAEARRLAEEAPEGAARERARGLAEAVAALGPA